MSSFSKFICLVVLCCSPCVPVIAGKAFDRRVNAAIQRGRLALVPLLEKTLTEPPGRYGMGKIALSLTALLESGLSTEEELVRRAFEKLDELPFQQTYSVACYLFALYAYWQAGHHEWKEKAAASGSKTTAQHEAVPRLPPSGPVREELAMRVAWLRHRPGAPHGDAPGRLRELEP